MLTPHRNLAPHHSYQSEDIDLRQHRQRIDCRLAELLNVPAGEASCPLHEVLEFAVLGGGKRLRPLLVMDIAGASEQAIDVGCAVELIHTASLLLDDLPCMDNASMRGGRQTTHRVFGEPAAILGAIALISCAHETLCKLPVPSSIRCELHKALARTIGQHGMASGQLLDVQGAAATTDEVSAVNALKTASLFVAGADMATRIAGFAKERREAALSYAEHVGQLFQLADDFLDVTGNETDLGKDVGKDKGKPTLHHLSGIDIVRSNFAEHLVEARNAAARAKINSTHLSVVASVVEVPEVV